MEKTFHTAAYDIAVKILLIGEAGVGKTHLILRYGKLSNRKFWIRIMVFS